MEEIKKYQKESLLMIARNIEIKNKIEEAKAIYEKSQKEFKKLEAIAKQKVDEINNIESKIYNVIEQQNAVYYNLLDSYTKVNQELLSSDTNKKALTEIQDSIYVIKQYINDLHYKIHKKLCQSCRNPLPKCIFCSKISNLDHL